MGLIAYVKLVLGIARQAARLTKTEADDKIVEGLIDLVELYENGAVSDKKAAAQIITARMFDA